MLKIMKELWDKNQDKLRTELSSRDDLNECSYVDLVKIAFDKIYNDDRFDVVEEGDNSEQE